MPQNEADRLKALEEFRILDTAPEQIFDDLVEIAGQVLGAPVSLITLVDESRQWFKARRGFDRTETPREHAFCAHTILGTAPLVVPDAQRDPRFADNPYVTEGPGIRFYAGAPLRSPDGHALGSLCVVDWTPREFTEAQGRTLEALARQASALLEWRRTMLHLADALKRIHSLDGLIPICSTCKDVREEEGRWEKVERFVMDRSTMRFTHGLCPSCAGGHG